MGNPLLIEPYLEFPPPPPGVGNGGAGIVATVESRVTIPNISEESLSEEKTVGGAAVEVQLPPIQSVPIIIEFLDGVVLAPVTSISHGDSCRLGVNHQIYAFWATLDKSWPLINFDHRHMIYVACFVGSLDFSLAVK